VPINLSSQPERVWDSSKPRLLWVLLNPSTADENHTDATNTRGEVRARELGFGANVFCNLFAWRSTSPDVLEQVPDPVGPHNHLVLEAEAMKAKTIICGWGVGGTLNAQGVTITNALKGAGHALQCLGTTKDGHPRHPLYVAYSVMPSHYMPPLEETL
jgi:hypothetical protein